MASRRGRFHEQHQAMRARRWRKERMPTGNYRVVSSDGRVHGIYPKEEADRVLRLLRKQQGR